MYVVHSDVIRSNIAEIRQAFKSHKLDLILTYSCKTNSMPQVLQIMKEEGVIPEVVSEHECDLIGDSLCLCNGVQMSHFETAYHVSGADFVNFNDMTQAQEVRKYLDLWGIGRCKAGVRVNFGDGSRFGVDVNNLRHMIMEMRNLKYDINCLHCHVTGTRELSKYKEKVSRLVDAVIDNDLEVEYLDFGGSMYGKMSEKLASQFDEVGSFDDYASIIEHELSRLSYKPKVILELGTALIANAVSLIGNVIRVDEYHRVVLDIDKFTIGMLKNKEVEYTFYPLDSSKMSPMKIKDFAYRVYGCTCIEDDVLIDEFPYEPSIGDMIEFHNCGAYSYCFEPEFIIPRQEVKVV